MLEKEFKSIQCRVGLDLLKKFQGVEREQKWFEQECQVCHYQPEDRMTPFLSTSLFIVNSGNRNLQEVLMNHFKQKETLQMRCACVPHKQNSNVFKQTCVSEEPRYLLIELRRYFTRDDPKSTNTIFPNHSIFINPEGRKYELTSIIDHDGSKISGGHYTALLFDGASWTRASECI